jgi:hypothetical protein
MFTTAQISADLPTEPVVGPAKRATGKVSSHAAGLHSRILIAAAAALVLIFLGAIFYLRQSGAFCSPETYLYLEVGGTLLSFCYAANALVRFRGTHDRTVLILAFGFVLSGIIEAVAYFGLDNLLASGPAALLHIPLGWMVSRTLLAVMLLAAIAVERYMPTARQPSKETAAALLVVAIAAYVTSAAFLAAPSAPLAHAQNILSRPWDLLPGVLFLLAAISFYQRIASNKNASTLYDYTLFAVAALNVVCHLSAAFSTHMFDGPFFLAELSKTAGYVVMLSGALLDQARLFDQVRTMAVSDSLTGLGNYRRLISVLEAELDRSRRTQRPFSIVLLDMDGLKAINDRYGRWYGSEKFCAVTRAPSIQQRVTAETNLRWCCRKPVRTLLIAWLAAFENAWRQKRSRQRFPLAPE